MTGQQGSGGDPKQAALAAVRCLNPHPAIPIARIGCS